MRTHAASSAARGPKAPPAVSHAPPSPRMRPSTLALALTLLAAPIAAAQRPARPYVGQTLAINPLALPFGFVSGEYERAVGPGGFALGVGGLTNFGAGAGDVLDRGEAYRTLEGKLKYYPREDGLRGFAVGVTAGVAHARERYYSSYTIVDANGTTFSTETSYRARTAPTLGATLDYNFFIGRRRRFLIGLGAGAKRTLGSRADGDPLGTVLADGRLQIGFGF